MRISDSGLAALKREEGCKLTAYTDSRGVWTIGTGHTGRVDGVAVNKGMTITQDTADRLLRDDLSWVERCIADRVTVPLNQNQHDALCSLIFNSDISIRQVRLIMLLQKHAGDDHFNVLI
ncbi:lysozyme [Salmonella enterica subsp. enterica serovar Newport]